MVTLLLLIAAAVCFFLDAIQVAVRRVSWTPTGLLLITIVLIISTWPPGLDVD